LTVTEDGSALDDLYKDLTREHLAPLWTQVGELMPGQPTPSAHPHVWQWKTLFELAERAGDLVRVERGGERRAIALANPGLGSLPFATPTLWAAIQYLAPGETAPEHRHTQNAFRFVVEGQGVWTVVDGDPVSMQRGDQTFCSRRAGISTGIRTSVMCPWRGWTVLTSPSSSRPIVGSSRTAPTR